MINVKNVEKFMGKLYPHQTEAVKAFETQSIGQCCIPTGAGKTKIQAALIVKEMVKNQDRNYPGVYLVGAHRIVLCHQLLSDIRKEVKSCNITCNILIVASEEEVKEADEEYDNEEEENVNIKRNIAELTSTSEVDIVNTVNLTKNLRVVTQLLVISTYHSLHRLEKIGPIDFFSCDEAHTVVENDSFKANIELIRPNVKRMFFFTATRKVGPKNTGMDDENRFGKILYKASHGEMVIAGQIVRPRFQKIYYKSEGELSFEEISKAHNDNMMIKIIMSGFEAHKDMLQNTKRARFIQPLGAKLLVSCEGTKAIKSIITDKDFISYCKTNDINVYAFASDENVGYTSNFIAKKRPQILKEMRDLGEQKQAIILHIDILTEGWDLQSLTGVLFMRKVTNIPLWQTSGRVLRIYGNKKTSSIINDRHRLHLPEGDPNKIYWDELAKFKKPFGHILFPVDYNQDEVMSQIIKDTMEHMEIPFEWMTNDAFCKGLDPEDVPPPVTDKVAKNNGEITHGLYHIYEDIILNKIVLTKKNFKSFPIFESSYDEITEDDFIENEVDDGVPVQKVKIHPLAFKTPEPPPLPQNAFLQKKYPPISISCPAINSKPKTEQKKRGRPVGSKNKPKDTQKKEIVTIQTVTAKVVPIESKPSINLFGPRTELKPKWKKTR